MDGKSEKPFLPTRSSFSNARYSPTMPRRSLEGNNISSNLQSDIVFNVDGVAFALHKGPLMARSGKIRKLLADGALEPGSSPRSKSLAIEFSNFPGGPEIFELSARFCYGISFELTTADVAPLRCAAEFLEMSGEDNLIGRTEAFLNEVVFESIEKSAWVLHSCERIMALAEEVRLVSRCIDAITSKVSFEERKHCAPGHVVRRDIKNFPTRSNLEYGGSRWNHLDSRHVEEYWWIECLLPLRFDLYQRVFTAMKARGIPCEALAGLLMQYSHKFLREIERQNALKQMATTEATSSPSTKSSKVRQVSFENSPKHNMQPYEQRLLLEMIIGLLLPGKQAALFPVGFLLALLQKAILLGTTIACQLDLERRIGLQLEQASVDDLLIPSISPASGGPMFDVDVVMRVLTSYSQQHEENCFDSDNNDLGGSCVIQKGIQNVSKLLDVYLAEVAPDPNLSTAKFISLAEQLPGYARALGDGLYRAIDIFLKTHPTLSDKEKKKICKLLDFRKLSREACLHAAQNDRLPVQVMVQMLYFEQTRMRDAIGIRPADHHESSSGVALTDRELNTGATLQRENQELMEEVARLKMLVSELQKENVALKKGGDQSNRRSGGLLSAVSRRIGKLFTSKEKDTVNARHPPRVRRHSVS